VIYSNTTQQNDNKFEPLQGGPQWYPARFWSLRASWTISNGGLRWVQSEKNKINYYESQMQFENTKKQSGINDENLRLSYERSTTLLSKAENIMNLSYDNYQHISNRYEAGLGSLEDRLQAFTDYINYQNQYLNSLSDMLVQLYQIKIRQQSF
jgi:outer membrane protein TolC